MIFKTDFGDAYPSVSKSLEQEWDRQLCLGRIPTASNSPHVSDSEIELYHQAKQLSQQGWHLKALHVYAKVMNEQLPLFKSVNFSISSDPARYTMKLMLSAFYEHFPSLRTELNDRCLSYCSFTERCMDMIPRPDDVHMLFIIRTIAEFLTMDYMDGPSVAQKLFDRVLEQLEKDPDRDQDEEMHVVQEMAKLYVHQGILVRTSSEGSTWSKQESIIRRGLAQMEKSLGSGQLDVLRFYHDLGSLYLRKDMISDAAPLFRQGHLGRRRILGEQHRDTLASLKSLYGIYVEQEEFVEAETLLSSAMGGVQVSETSAASPRSHFSRWSHSDAFQGKLASLCTPGVDFYWEDSRTYLRPLRQIELLAAFPPDPFPQVPAKVTVVGRKLEISIPSAILSSKYADNQSASFTDIIDMVKAMSIYRELEYRAKKQEWSIFQMDRKEFLSYEHGTTEAGSMTYDQLPPYPQKPVFWIFVEDKESREDFTTSESSDNASTKPVKRNVHYQFLRLPVSGNEFIAVAKTPHEIDLEAAHRRICLSCGQRPNTLPAQVRVKSFNVECRYPADMRYSVRQKDDLSIDLMTTYVPYFHFQQSRGFGLGCKYTEYLEILNRLRHPHWFLENIFAFKKRLCQSREDVEKKVRTWMPTKSHHASQPDPQRVLETCVEGFFNGIPGDSVLLDMHDEAGGHNFVSSNWVDWNSFTLHTMNPDGLPKLTFPDGDAVQCHGYISGTWTQRDADRQWTGIQCFVVDAVFSRDGLDGSHHFLFGSNTLGSENCHLLSLTEKRFHAGALNHALFRFAPTSEDWVGGSKWKRRPWRKVLQDTASSSDTDTFFDEMNRRERWDRAFEKASKDLNISIDGFGKDLEKSGLENEPLYEEKRVEHQRRVRWDADHGKKPRPLDESLRRIGLSTTE